MHTVIIVVHLTLLENGLPFPAKTLTSSFHIKLKFENKPPKFRTHLFVDTPHIFLVDLRMALLFYLKHTQT